MNATAGGGAGGLGSLWAGLCDAPPGGAIVAGAGGTAIYFGTRNTSPTMGPLQITGSIQ